MNRDESKTDLTKAPTANEFLAKYLAEPENERLFRESEAGFDVSQRMKEMRRFVKLTQVELGKRVGCTQSFIAKMESGAYDRCGIGTLRTFARAMGQDLNVAEMFTGMAAPLFNGRSSCSDLEQTFATQELFSEKIANIAIKVWARSEMATEEIAAKFIDPIRKVTGAAA